MTSALLAQAGDGSLSSEAQIFAVVGTLLFLIFVLELVRRRRLVERYALLWIAFGLVGVVFAVWNGLLDSLADLTGIQSPANALFLIALGVIFALLLNFSAAISRLSEETKILAQTISRLDAENRELRGEGPAATNGASATEEPEGDAPVGAEQAGDDA